MMPASPNSSADMMRGCLGAAAAIAVCGIERPDRLDQYVAAAADAAAQTEHLRLEDVDDARHANAEVVYIGVDHLHGGLVARAW